MSVRSVTVALVVAGLWSSPASGQGAETPRASASASPPPPVEAPPPATDRAALMQSLLRFVLDEFLGTGRADHVNRADLYAPQVVYYNRGRLARAAVMADKAAYYRRWPSRVYVYVPDSLRIENAGEAGVTIVFRHSFVVANGANRRSGIAVTRLGVTLENGRFVIVQETGAVDRRAA
jgi:hypothetical protein